MARSASNVVSAAIASPGAPTTAVQPGSWDASASASRACGRQLGVEDERRRARVVENVRGFAGREAEVDRRRDRAEAQRREPAERELGPVEELEDDRLPGPHAARRELARQPLDVAPELGVGPGRARPRPRSARAGRRSGSRCGRPRRGSRNRARRRRGSWWGRTRTRAGFPRGELYSALGCAPPHRVPDPRDGEELARTPPPVPAFGPHRRGARRPRRAPGRRVRRPAAAAARTFVPKVTSTGTIRGTVPLRGHERRPDGGEAGRQGAGPARQRAQRRAAANSSSTTAATRRRASSTCSRRARAAPPKRASRSTARATASALALGEGEPYGPVKVTERTTVAMGFAMAQFIGAGRSRSPARTRA